MKKTLLSMVALIAIAGSAMAQGYYSITSTGTPSDYTSGSVQGSAIIPNNSNDILSATQTIPFAWNFYGQAVTSYKASDNGYITFDNAETTSQSNNISIPDASAPKNAIFGFWDNLALKATITNVNNVADVVNATTLGTAPNRRHVIQWFSVSSSISDTSYLYFAIVLKEAGGFDVIYNDANFSRPFTATIGCQNADGTIATMVGGNSLSDFPNKLGSRDNATDKVYSFIYGTQPANNVKLSSVNLETFAVINSEITLSGTVTNLGADALNAFKVNYSVNGGETFTMSIKNITPIVGNGNGTYSFVHNIPYNTPTGGVANFRVWITEPNAGVDGDESDNEKLNSILVADRAIPRRTLGEVFTSSTCPPCNPGNAKINTVLKDRAGKFALLKYQYYFPGTGDPYFTFECLNRGEYYGGVSGVPQMQIDGGWSDNPNYLTAEIFDKFQNKITAVDMTSSLTMTGQKADIAISVTPTLDIPAGNYRLRVALVEKETTKNIKTNGETKFQFVMKKMLPDSGIVFNFGDKDVKQTINVMYTFPGAYKLPTSAVVSTANGTAYNGVNLATEHSVEEFYDMAVVAFIQNDDTKEVYQSTWTMQDWALGMEDVKKASTTFEVYPNPTSSSFNISWNGNHSATFSVLDINGKVVMNSSAINNESINCEQLSTGIYFVELNDAGKIQTKKLTIIK